MSALQPIGAGRTSAAVIAAPVTALALTAALTAVLPMAPDARLLAAMLAVFPAMALGACLALRSRNGGRAWLACAALTALSFLLFQLR